jgi:Uma2 family endonuclease
MLSALRPPRTIYQVWKSLPEGTLCQIINNNLVMAPAPLDSHQAVLNDINIALSLFVRKRKLGLVRIAPYDVHFSKQNIFQPDIIFVANANKGGIEPKGLVGPPDLVIEILSPGTAQKDLGEKKDVYEQYGIREYFVVDPESKIVRSFILKGKSFAEQPKAIAVVHSPMLKCKINF